MATLKTGSKVSLAYRHQSRFSISQENRVFCCATSHIVGIQQKVSTDQTSQSQREIDASLNSFKHCENLVNALEENYEAVI